MIIAELTPARPSSVMHGVNPAGVEGDVSSFDV